MLLGLVSEGEERRGEERKKSLKID